MNLIKPYEVIHNTLKSNPIIIHNKFISEINDFHELAYHFMNVADKLSGAVEKEKMAALGARNMLKSISKQREAKQLQLLVIQWSKTVC